MGPDLEKPYNNDASSQASTEVNDFSSDDSATELGDWSDDETGNQGLPLLRRQNAQMEPPGYSVFRLYPDPRPAENPNAEHLPRPQRAREHGIFIHEFKEEKHAEFKR